MQQDISTWTQADLEAHIHNQIPESLSLDYKSAASLKRSDQSRNEISKDVSAFANAAGGRIIYGIIEQHNRPSKIDLCSLDPLITREWLEQTINSTIHPRIAGVRIKEIDLSGGCRAFVVDIPQATNFAPHQASDHKYYRRFNFQSVPMADYEIRDAMRRGNKPDLFCKFLFVGGVPIENGVNSVWNIKMGNRAAEPALYSCVDVFFEHGSTGNIDGWEQSVGPCILGAGEPLTYCHILSYNLVVPHHQPIFKERIFLIGTLSLILGEARLHRIGIQLSAPGFVKSTYFTIAVVDGVPGVIQEIDAEVHSVH